MDGKYTLSVYVAAPGTPLLDGGTSAAGHVYYDIAHESDRKSFGFAPIKHGVIAGPGKIYDTDAEQYQKPFYKRTMEISREQYDKLNEFGSSPDSHGFSMQYNGASNSCIDFTWGALNHAGLHRTNVIFMQDRDYEGSLKPLSNESFIRSIRAPFPGSELNKEDHNLMPDRTLLQRFISEEDLPPNDRQILESVRIKVSEIDRQHGRSFDQTSERISTSLMTLAKENGMQRVDHVVLSAATAEAAAGHRMFVVEGALDDPSHSRASMLTTSAAERSSEDNYAKLEQISNDVRQREVAQQADQQEQVTRDAATMRMS
ncbi:hypothetical protein ICJ04_02015 [Stenotrophomonas sp. 169]|uniref:XVIPCD domain-containing protein n=1 Tax=unclassified Stenotrophomonas TaxID=196198 RepID=UPI00166282B4|nr:XVIPCD domain-containing protein [Stenotrophomonas sp. 169]QNR97719.1 hypothetical protein ICJ04_02015 [Stenotrophomonas sp. 169]